MGAQILSPILDVFPRSGLLRVPSHPSPNVVREPHEELWKILGDDKSIMPNVMSVHEHDSIAGIALLRE
jgi:hypothetical protein